MRKENRIALTIFAFITCYYFLYFLPFILILGGPNKNDFIAKIASLLIAITITFFLWKKRGVLSDTLANYIIRGGIITGFIGFILGFIGPMIFWPDANQGPMLGIFLTGPIGFLLGLLGGGLLGWLKLRNK